MRVAFGFVLVAVLAACGTATEPPSDPAPTTIAEGESTTTTVPAVTDEQDRVVALAIEDLAGSQSVEEDEVALVSYEKVTWRDGSIGCPVEGRSYTQALVDGYRIILEVGGEEYHYHGAGSGDPFLCQNPQDPLPGGSSGDA
jgi:hypothetical protein